VVAEAADSFSLGTSPPPPPLLYLLYWYKSTNAAKAWRECVVVEAADSFALGSPPPPPTLLALLVQKAPTLPQRGVARAGDDDACIASVTRYSLPLCAN
jgi:hypothetical protein